MPIDFNDSRNRRSYAMRDAHETWRVAIQDIVDIRGKMVADIGCGGGIYSRALAEMGAAQVVGIDSSPVMLDEARRNTSYAQIRYTSGDACATGEPGGHYDVLLERAVIHHLPANKLPVCFAEALRLLTPGGILIVQDRTPEDCLQPGSPTHPRGYFFTLYPRLREREIARRPSDTQVREALQQAGLQVIETRTLWETRQLYRDREHLARDLRERTGRSILHELNDRELEDLIAFIHENMPDNGHEIIEQDRWTLWIGRKTS